MLRAKTFRWWHVIPLLGLLLAVVLPLLSTGTAYAASCTWKDTSDITCDNTTYSNPSISGTTMTLGLSGSCSTLTIKNYTTAKTASVLPGVTNLHTSACSPGGTATSVTLTNTYNTIAGAGTGAGGTAAANGAQTQSPDCSLDGDPMTWILCPIFDAVSNASDWLFQSIVEPFLVTPPVQTSASDPSFQVWSTFRIYGDVFLVIAVLVVVIGQAIGGGLVDAYTAKKVLPRILLTAILINLSIYIVAFLVDITNIVGKSIGDMLTQPFQASHQWSFSPDAKASLGVFGAGLLGIIIYKSSLWGVLKGLFFPSGSHKAAQSASFGKIALYAALMIAIPILLSILAVFVTLIIRKGLILFLILISPVAFALYCLPATERYFKKWWDLLFEALMVYPIIVAIFAIADILSITILMANSVQPADLTPDKTGNVTDSSILATIVAFFLQFLPLFAVPFAFRMAGGTLAKLHETVANGHQKFAQLGGIQKEKERATGRFNVRRKQAQKEAYDNWMGRAGKQDTSTWMGRRRGALYGKMARAAGGFNIESEMSAINAEAKKQREQDTGYGPDNLRRAASVDQDMLRIAKSKGAQGLRAAAAAHGWTEGSDFSVGADGQAMLGDLTGKMYDVATADRASKVFGGDQGAMQENLQYAMGKATKTDEKARIAGRYSNWAQSMGWSEDVAQERWTGAAYADQAKDKNYKYYKYQDELDSGGYKLDQATGSRVDSNNNILNAAGVSTGEKSKGTRRSLQLDALGQVMEMNREQGSWEHGKFSAATYHDLAQQVANAHATVGDGRTRGVFKDDPAGPGAQTGTQKAEKFLKESAKLAADMESGSGPAVDPSTGAPIPGASRGIGYGASPETAEAMKAFVATTKVHAGEYESQAGVIPTGTPIRHVPGPVRQDIVREGQFPDHPDKPFPGSPSGPPSPPPRTPVV